jgi:hypothetical protein
LDSESNSKEGTKRLWITSYSGSSRDVSVTTAMRLRRGRPGNCDLNSCLDKRFLWFTERPYYLLSPPSLLFSGSGVLVQGMTLTTHHRLVPVLKMHFHPSICLRGVRQSEGRVMPL